MSTDFVFTSRTSAELGRAHALAVMFASEARVIPPAESRELASGDSERSDWAAVCYHVAHSVALTMPLAADGLIFERAQDILSAVTVAPGLGEPEVLREYEVAVKLPDGQVTVGATAPNPAAAGAVAIEGLVSIGVKRGTLSVLSAWRKGARPFYTISPADVGRSTINAFGKIWRVADFIGTVIPGDVGKRVYLQNNAANDYKFLQAENDKQRDARVARGE